MILFNAKGINYSSILIYCFFVSVYIRWRIGISSYNWAKRAAPYAASTLLARLKQKRIIYWIPSEKIWYDMKWKIILRCGYINHSLSHFRPHFIPCSSTTSQNLFPITYDMISYGMIHFISIYAIGIEIFISQISWGYEYVDSMSMTYFR